MNIDIYVVVFTFNEGGIIMCGTFSNREEALNYINFHYDFEQDRYGQYQIFETILDKDVLP